MRKRRVLAFNGAILGAGIFISLFYQNCAPQGTLESMSSMSLPSSQPPTGDEFGGGFYPIFSGSLLEDSTSGRALSIRLIDKSKSDGSIVTYVEQQAFGAGAGLRACTGTVQNLRSACLKDSDFTLMPGVYNSSNDSYSVLGTEASMKSMRWPFTEYFNRYLAADGSHVTLRWKPTLATTSPSSGSGSASSGCGSWGPGSNTCTDSQPPVSQAPPTNPDSPRAACEAIYGKGGQCSSYDDKPLNFLVDSTSGFATRVVLTDNSRGNGSIVTEIDQSVSGSMIGQSIKACTGTIATRNTSCTKLTDFKQLASNFNNASGPTGFYTVGDVRALNWPHTTYFNRYLLPDGSHVTRTWTPQVNHQTNYLVDSASGQAINIRVVDSSRGTGSALRIDQKVYSGGTGLRACTATIQSLRTSCNKESDFVAMPGDYDRVNNVYHIGPAEVAWPFVTYFSRFIAADGSHVTRTWSPTGIGYPSAPGWGP